MSVAAAVGRRVRELGRLVRGVLGEDAYDAYLAHMGAAAAGAPGSTHGAGAGGQVGGGEERVLSAREFWRDRSDRQDREPQGRCC